MVLPLTNPVFSTLVMMAMLLLLLLLLLHGTGWLLLVMADPPIGREAENHIQAKVTVKTLQRQLMELSSCYISCSGT